MRASMTLAAGLALATGFALATSPSSAATSRTGTITKFAGVDEIVQACTTAGSFVNIPRRRLVERVCFRYRLRPIVGRRVYSDAWGDSPDRGGRAGHPRLHLADQRVGAGIAHRSSSMAHRPGLILLCRFTLAEPAVPNTRAVPTPQLATGPVQLPGRQWFGAGSRPGFTIEREASLRAAAVSSRSRGRTRRGAGAARSRRPRWPSSSRCSCR